MPRGTYWKGKRRSEETKKKLSESKIGDKNPMWGKHPSEETLQKMRESSKNSNNKGRFRKGNKPWNAGKKSHQIPWNKGLTKETDIRLHEMGEKHRGYQPSDEVRMKLSEKVKKQWEDPCFAKKAMGGLWHQRGMTPRFKGAKHSEKSRKLMGDALKKKWKESEYVQKQMIANNVQPNKVEMILESVLDYYFPGKWTYTGDGKNIINGLCPDFTNANGEKKLIELFGMYWHKGKKNIKQHQTEDGRKSAYAEKGYQTLVIWENELVDEDRLVEKIRSF